MKNLLLIFGFALTALTMDAQENTTPHKYLEKVKTLDQTIETLYAVISGPAGEERNWELFQYLFAEGAQLIPSGADQNGTIGWRYWSPTEYQNNARKWLEENGFFEKEISRKVERFGNMVHAFSTYESFKTSTDEKPFMRGINSIQLAYDGTRWWVINIYWVAESPALPLPKKYLKK